MNEQNFHSDVGQVAGGSIVNTTHGPSQSNVITINGMAPPEKPPTITDLQRQAIRAKAQPIAEAGGIELLDIYRIVFTRFGIERIRELPRAEFLNAMAFLSDLEKGESDSDSAAEEEPSAATTSHVPAIHFHPAPCQGCVGLTGELALVEKQARAARVWAGTAITALFAVSAAVAGAFYTGSIEAKARIGKQVCHFADGVYSVGSVLPIAGSKTRECLPDAEGNGAHWETVGTPVTKR
ncbi:hypothetical protein [Pandoraea apista]|uniref:hypothetical protein n=1 Tax=Pandoraea apista TaxID=93218 RepID=UPI000F677EC5|nr:hypothetical protein [Pandoraea apista]RRW94273.1 hypothetical protein EGJ54_18205 [Pandoraea apista]RRX00631.1 hypothetical protein EGJ56_18850 [Pandoraea apista]